MLAEAAGAQGGVADLAHEEVCAARARERNEGGAESGPELVDGLADLAQELGHVGGERRAGLAEGLPAEDPVGVVGDSGLVADAGGGELEGAAGGGLGDGDPGESVEGDGLEPLFVDPGGAVRLARVGDGVHASTQRSDPS